MPRGMDPLYRYFRLWSALWSFGKVSRGGPGRPLFACRSCKARFNVSVRLDELFALAAVGCMALLGGRTLPHDLRAMKHIAIDTEKVASLRAELA